MEEFAESLATLRSAIDSPLLEFEEVPPPSRMAPFTAALVMRTMANDGREPLAQGRFVILHDPDEQAGWNGTYRLVAQLRSQVDPEMGHDPLLTEALWAWTDDCLLEEGAAYHDLTGTVTREFSESFGGLSLRGSTLNVEIRASWTPSTTDLGAHLRAWTDLMLRTSGVASQRFLEGV